jgi:hypothetical protein
MKMMMMMMMKKTDDQHSSALELYQGCNQSYVQEGAYYGCMLDSVSC